MHVFENPYVVMAALVLGVVLLAAIGVYFAIKGIKTVEGLAEKQFIPVGKIETVFNKLGKSREDRTVLYISLSADNLRGLFSEPDLLSEIKLILLDTLTSEENSFISVYDERNFIALLNCDSVSAKSKVEFCQVELNKRLLKYSALNIVNIRFGIFFAGSSSVMFDDAIIRAKQACMVAKNQIMHYSEWNSTIGKALEKKIKIENNIEKEIDNNRFFLEYQPVIDAKTGKIIGAEVLSRLNSESEGVLTPKSFLSAVDSVGINEKFDYYIFEKNCRWISNDKEQRENYKYTINFSRSTISEPEFVEKITGIAEKYDLKFSCLAVEILEDKNIDGEAKQQMIENLSTLKGKGVSILLDDFGSGYTTFGDLQNLDVSIVKIDKAITQNSVTDTGFIILKNLIQTSKDIGFKTLCEGIETKEQEEAAINAGCDFLQGFYYYRPMSVATLEKILETSGGN